MAPSMTTSLSSTVNVMLALFKTSVRSPSNSETVFRDSLTTVPSRPSNVASVEATTRIVRPIQGWLYMSISSHLHIESVVLEHFCSFLFVVPLEFNQSPFHRSACCAFVLQGLRKLIDVNCCVVNALHFGYEFSISSSFG